MTIEQAVDEVQVARPAAPCAYRQLAREVRFGTRCEGGHLLVPDVDPFDLALTSQCIRESVEAVVDDAVHPLHTGQCEGLCESIREGSSHHGTS